METPTLIITGASRGLGAAVARLAAEMGANLVLNARSADELAGVAHRIEEAGGQAIAVPGDVSEQAEGNRLVERAIERFGRLDGLVNNAGIIQPIASVATSDIAAWERTQRVNVIAPLMLIQAALPHLRASGGRVINVSSGAATSAISGWSAYCASKAALNQLTAVLAREESAITALALRPGLVDTEMQADIRREGTHGMAGSGPRALPALPEPGPTPAAGATRARHCPAGASRPA